MPSPWSLSKSGTEHSQQAALFCWLHIATNYGFQAAWEPTVYEVKGAAAEFTPAVAIPELEWVFAIPNGGSRGSTPDQAKRVGAQMKAEGVKPGVSDLFVPIPRHGLSGLFIEMKRVGGGSGLSPEQKAFGAFVKSQNFGFMQANGWIEAAYAIQKWIHGPKIA